jgi:hypothetical protein
MATAKEARQAVQTRLVDSSITIPIYWQNEQQGNELPDEPTPFAFAVFDNDGPGFGPASFGDGILANRWRNVVRLEVFVFVPQGTGADQADDYAEAICARLRSYRDNTISCFGAHVRETTSGAAITPAGINSAAGNYWCAVAEIDMFFDQVG